MPHLMQQAFGSGSEHARRSDRVGRAPVVCLELIVPDRDRLADQTTVRNSSQHMQFFDLFAGLSRDPADCPSVIHRHALFFVRHLYVFRAAQCKSVLLERASACGIGGECTQLCAFGPRGFLLLKVLILCNSGPTSSRDTSKTAPLKTSLPIKAAR